MTVVTPLPTDTAAEVANRPTRLERVASTIASVRSRPFGRVSAAGLAGILVALSIPPFGWWPLAWVGIAVLAAALPGCTWKARLALGAAFGLTDFLIGLLWVQEFSAPGYLAVVVISTIYSMLALLLVPAERRYVALGLPCMLVLADAARDRFPLGGLPLGSMSLGQAAGPLAPSLRLGGSLLLTGVTALAGVALWLTVDWLVAVRWRAVLVPVAPGGAIALAVLLPVAGLLSPSGAGGHASPLRIALVQGGGARGTRAIRTDPQIVFDRHMDASSTLHAPLDLVVWPEGVLQSQIPYSTTQDAYDVSDLAVRLGATVLIGVEQDVGATHYLNEVVAWSPQGQIVGTYVKNHLVPFGEYVPYRSLIQRLFNVADVPLDGIPGRGPGFLRTPAGPLTLMISFEVFFDSRARGGVRAGGQVLVVPTNTASYRSTQVPTQEVAADRLRAWETGRWLIQVTPTGYSDVVSPTGEVTAKSHLSARQVVEATVPRRDGFTVFDRIGEMPVVGAAAAVWLAAALAARVAAGRGSGSGWRPRRRRRTLTGTGESGPE